MEICYVLHVNGQKLKRNNQTKIKANKQTNKQKTVLWSNITLPLLPILGHKQPVPGVQIVGKVQRNVSSKKERGDGVERESEGTPVVLFNKSLFRYTRFCDTL